MAVKLRLADIVKRSQQSQELAQPKLVALVPDTNGPKNRIRSSTTTYVRKTSGTKTIITTGRNLASMRGNTMPIDEEVTMQQVPIVSSFRYSNKVTKLLTEGATATNSNTSISTAPIPSEKNTTEDVNMYHERKMRQFRLDRQAITDQLECDISEAEREVLQRRLAVLEDQMDDYFVKTMDVLHSYHTVSTNEEEEASARAPSVDGDAFTSLNEFLHRKDPTAYSVFSNDFFRRIEPEKVDVASLARKTSSCDDDACAGFLELHNGVFTCMSCGIISSKSGEDLQWGFKDIQDVSIKNGFAYKKTNRFMDQIRSMQGKENADVPIHVIQAVYDEIMKESEFNLDKLTTRHIKQYLKRTGFVKYYDHSAYIIDHIKGSPPLDITAEEEEIFYQMFLEIQEPFEAATRQVMPVRKSFLSYPYVLYKFAELLGMQDKLKYFQLLKSREKLDVHDRIWKKICEQTGYPFYRSM